MELQPEERAELALHLVCDLYAQGALGKVAAAKMAGVDFFTLQSELHKRNIPTYSEEMLDHDVASIDALFKK